MYHVATDELLGPNQAAREGERLPANIRDREEVQDALHRQLEDIRVAEAALRSSEERWRSVFENSAIGIVLADPAGKIIEANRAVQEAVGYTSPELKAVTYVDITPGTDIHRGEEVIQH